MSPPGGYRSKIVSLEVLRIGNVPVTRLELESKLTGLLEPILEVKS